MDEYAANDTVAKPDLFAPFLRAVRPTIALAAAITGTAYFVVGLVAVFWLSFSTGANPSRVLFFAELPSDFVETLKTGSLPFANAFGNVGVVAALACLYGFIQLVTAAAIMLPMDYSRPFAMQAGIAGFFWAYVITLLLLGELALDFRVLLGALRILWILAIFGLIERVKYAYPSHWRGAGQFPLLADGVFALMAGLIIQQGLGDGYAAALSGIIFVIVYFGFMVLFE